MERRIRKPGAELADKAHEDLNVTPHFDCGLADFLGNSLARRLAGDVHHPRDAIVEQIRELRPQSIDAQIAVGFVLQTAQMNQQSDPGAVAVLDAGRIDQNVCHMGAINRGRGAPPYAAGGARIETARDNEFQYAVARSFRA